MANEVLPVVYHTPVLAGVCSSDPFRNIPRFLSQLKDVGFSGVQNFPTEETGMGYELEVEMVREAKKLGLLTTPYVFNADQSTRMAKAEADLIVAHLGLTTKGSIGASRAKTLDDCVRLTQEMADAAHAVNPDIIVLVHCGPVAESDDVQYLLKRTKRMGGFYGEISLERLPVEIALREGTQKFKNVRLP